MLFNTVSTLGLSRRLQGSLTDVQIELSRAGDEVASGKHVDVAEHLGARTGRAISLRNLYDDVDEHLKTCSLLDGRFSTMNSAMTSILAAGQDVLASASTGLGQPSPTGTSLQIRARGALEQIVGLLNASSGNGYLFGGVEVSRPPVRNVAGDSSGLRSPITIVQDAIAAATGGPAAPVTAADSAAAVATLDTLFATRDPATPPPAPLTDTFEGGFYVGATALKPGGTPNPRLTGRPDASVELAYGVQANDPGVRSLLEGLYMLAAVDTSKLPLDAYQPYVQAAVDRLSAGTEGMRDATAQLGIQHATLLDVAERHRTHQKILADQINDLENVDPAQASVRLNQLEMQVEATASVTARIARLRLTNYL
ncbi:flagellin [Azospirillum sp. TSO22-1]|uniref:flagellin n=1 Tax=Azospirillum sp. TSO22-1 TaxID=716789 RepID=UPI000D6152C1|nr:flagellin [Azospirillum sp. TSO22-1]PWC42578.1 flagellar hook protein [Azospirillum sp. TSO22-1]